jgi:hypothetical protein
MSCAEFFALSFAAGFIGWQQTFWPFGRVMAKTIYIETNGNELGGG